jgi:hypothetical protein
MTSSTTVKAASSGTDTTETETKAPRERGISRLREEECYHLTAIVRDALTEAEHLTSKVHSLTSSRFIDWDGSKGTEPLDRAELGKTLHEAYDCAAIALGYLYEAHEQMSVPSTPNAAEPDWL